MHDNTKLVEVELWSIKPSALEATRNTLKLLGSSLVEKDGKFYVPSGYIAFACERQGYVKRIVK